MQNIKYYIQNSGISADKLSQKSGISPERLGLLLAGTLEPTLSDIRKFSKALNLSTDFLLSESDKFEEINVLFRQAS